MPDDLEVLHQRSVNRDRLSANPGSGGVNRSV